MEAVILAGGKGTRLQDIVSDRPKPMADVNGKPFLEYLMDFLLKYDCSHFILSTGYMKEAIRDHFGVSYKNIPISYSEEEVPLGTGGAVLQSLDYLRTNKPSIILNGDTFFDFDLSDFTNTFIESNADLFIALFQTTESNRYGKVTLNNRGKMNMAFSQKANTGELASGGFFIMNKSIKNLFQKDLKSFSFEEDFLPEICKNGAWIGGMKFDAQFVDIGMPKDYDLFKKIALNFLEYQPLKEI